MILASAALLAAGPAWADRFRLDIGPGFNVLWNNSIAIGVGVRIAERNKEFIGKSNLNPDLCDKLACISVNPDNLKPHKRWMGAPGAPWIISDNGNLNYDQWDLTAGLVKWRSELRIRHDDWGLELSWLAYYDFVNATKEAYYPNIILKPSEAPGIETTLPRPETMEDSLQYDVQIRRAFVFFQLPLWGDRELDVRIGRQIWTWGTALFTISGSLNFINPINFNNFFRPAADLSETYRPVGMIRLGTHLTRRLQVQGFYQFEWRPYALPARDAFWSFVADVSTKVADSDAFPLLFGKTPEDPYQLQQNANPVLGLVSDTSLSADRTANREPSDLGQYGIKISYFTDWLGGTEFAFYYANYHARIPSVSAISANATCARREGNPMGIDVAEPGNNTIQFFRACGLTPLGPANGGNLTKRNAVPVDTVNIFLEYPEDIHLFGVSFNTTAWNIAWAGELAYRPNKPLQVDVEDVFFVALQPVFPREKVPIVPNLNFSDTLDGLGLSDSILANLDNTLLALAGLPGFEHLEGATLADSEFALPAYLWEYRGNEPGEVPPNTYIRGYERMGIWQGAISGTKIFGRQTQLLGADSVVVLLELSAAWVPNLPPLSELQFDSLLTTNTHYSPGIEETNNALKINPYMEDAEAFPDPFSWGYKLGIIAAYNDVLIPGLQLRPQLFLFHDVDGTTPGLAGNFQEGRKIMLVNLRTSYGPFDFDITGFFFWGGGMGNRLRDRDFVNFALTYHF